MLGGVAQLAEVRMRLAQSHNVCNADTRRTLFEIPCRAFMSALVNQKFSPSFGITPFPVSNSLQIAMVTPEGFPEELIEVHPEK